MAPTGRKSCPQEGKYFRIKNREKIQISLKILDNFSTPIYVCYTELSYNPGRQYLVTILIAKGDIDENNIHERSHGNLCPRW
jgi:hypothetical protein